MSNTCSLCNSTYVWPADLKRHLKSKHLSSSSHIRLPQSSSSSRSSSSHTRLPQSSSSSSHACLPQSSTKYNGRQKNLITWYKPTILTHFTFPINTIPIISCHGSIRLPVWLPDQQEVENRCLSDGSFTISNTWWLPSQIASHGVMVNIRRCMEP